MKIPGNSKENKVIFTEMEEFVLGLQFNKEGPQKPDNEDAFMEEIIKETDQGKETPLLESDRPDKTIHESGIGKGLAGALRLLKDRGSLKETVELGGRNMDKKTNKLAGFYDYDNDKGEKEILIERTDEYGRIVTEKEAFRLLSHRFHGKRPGKNKLEKRRRRYQEELRVKQMRNGDTPSQSVERMREVQARRKQPYVVVSGRVKP